MKVLKTTIAYMLLFVTVGNHAVAQGDLTPQEAPQPTMKTLGQVEPRTDLATVQGDAAFHHVISRPGSYYMSGNLNVTNANGIHVNTRGVTLDLNGFEISRSSGIGGDGIYVASGMDGTIVCNGSIRGFNSGIACQSKCSLFEKLSVSGCAAYGIYAESSSRIIDCRVFDNMGTGIHAEEGASLSGCIASENEGSYGIFAEDGSSLSGCIAIGNQVAYAIFASFGSSLSGCTAYDNQGIGIDAGRGASLSGCVAWYNQGRYGIYSGYGSSLRDCVAYDNVGISSFTSYGIYVDGCSTVIGCAAYKNSNIHSPINSSQGIGIYAVASATVKDCSAGFNRGDGIRVGTRCLVEGNVCDYNGYSIGDGAGIHATGKNNRIEANNITGNDRGIDIDSTDNLVLRNSTSGNTTNYVIAASNKVGVIVSAPISGAISGSTGGAGMGTTDPWANFSF